uniref:Glutamate receptor n=1 Tax=Kalanchoe fedtschenkoi TaxID=63787 RepID=A0A7N0TD81_KALFE
MISKKKASFGHVCSQYALSLVKMVCLMCLAMAMAASANTTSYITVNIGVVLDTETHFGRKSLASLSLALNDFYSSHADYRTRIALLVRNSKQDVVSAASAALDLIKNEKVEVIIGPGTSMQANFMLNLGDKAQVPIISFSATSPSLSPFRHPYFFRATLNDSAQVKALSSLVKLFSWREAVPVYVGNEYGEGMVPFLTDALQEVDCRVPYRSAIPPDATDVEIREELYKLMTMQTRVFIVHMLPDLGVRVFKNAMEIGMMGEGFVWILSNGIGDMLNGMDFTVRGSMRGVLGVQTFVPNSSELENFKVRWKRKFQLENLDVLDAELDVFGIWAHEAALGAAMTVEKVFGRGSPNGQAFSKSNTSVNSSEFEDLGVSYAGRRLKDALEKLSFEGFMGSFRFVNGEVPVSAFRIINVIGNGWKDIGFWTPQNGISRDIFMSLNDTSIASSKPNLGIVIWPGETTSVPRGWAIPVSGKKLRVGVPVRDGFFQFVRITRDPITNATKASGYCIDVFEAVMQAMPYAVSFEYIPYSATGSAMSYNDLTYQVFTGTFDAVVGDVTIVANRSLYVDFTLPYTESGVSMIVPVKDDRNKNAWVFLKPLTWKLWFTSFCFFIFIGFVIWVLEHRTNKDFRGPPLHQIGMMFWFSFSTMVFAHKEKVVSNLARFVVIVWVFVVLILIQTYTASLTSMLTVQKLQPTITDVNELIKRGDMVGYQSGSFVSGLLKNLGFAESKLVQYNSMAALEEVFRKGSGNGGVSAVFDEIPYMRLFLGKHCTEYAMVGPTYKTDGFGFVFPRGSPLAPDVSRAILNVTQGDQMAAIERSWFWEQTTCPVGESASLSPTSSSIGLDSFWGLFLIAGLASVSALTLFAATFLYQHRQVLSQLDGSSSLWNKVVVLSRHFDRKDLSSHTFKKFRFKENGTEHVMGGGSAEASPHPMNSPAQTDFSFYCDQGTPNSSEHDDHSQERTSDDRWVTPDDPPIRDSSQSEAP